MQRHQLGRTMLLLVTRAGSGMRNGAADRR
jgi:hypothetical protein